MRSVPPFVSTSTPTSVDVGHAGVHTQFHTEVFELAGGGRAQPIAEGSEWLLAAVDEHHPHRRRIERRELTLQAPRGQLADLPRDLDSGGTGAHDDDGEPFPPFLGSGGRLGELERAQDAAPQLHGVVDRLHAGRVERELVVAEVGLTRPGGDDQRVVRELDALSVGSPDRVHDAAFEIEPLDLEELDGDAGNAAQHVSERRRDLPGREHAGRDLVQQRLEEMVVASVDQRDLDALDVAEETAAGRPPKPPPDHDHVMRHSSSMRARVVEGRLPVVHVDVRGRVILSELRRRLTRCAESRRGSRQPR